MLPEVHPLFLPLAALSLQEKKRPGAFHIDMPSSEGTYSCGTLDSISSRSSASVSMLEVGQLSQSRDRCLSEPSMYFSSPQTLALNHTPVIRQSSYDAAVTDSRKEQSLGSTGLIPDQQSQNPGMGPRRRRYTFWKSPQIPTRFRHPAQRLASMSSLSSATTSSLSSLDSTLSLSSADTIPSPKDPRSRPFLFGAAARLRPLTPEVSKKSWTSTFTYEEEEDFWSERDQETENEKENESFHDYDEERGVKIEEIAVSEDAMSFESFGDIHEVKSATHSMSEGLSETVCSFEFSVNPLQPSTTCQKEFSLDLNSQAISLNPYSMWTASHANPIDCAIQESQVKQTLTNSSTTTQKQSKTQAENSASQLQLKLPNAHSNMQASGGKKVSRMKITFFPSAGRIMLKHSKATNQTSNTTKNTLGEAQRKVEPGFSEEKERSVRESVQVQIPQTLFYGHNVPLVLLSTPPVQVRTHCTPPEDVGETDAGLCDRAKFNHVTTEISNGVSSYPAENDVQRVKCVSHSTVEDLHSSCCINDTTNPAVSIRDGCSVNRSIKLIHCNANQSVAIQKPFSKSSGNIRHTICIKLPGNRGVAQNKPIQ